jgi:GT2 family glycosyltransferase
MQRMTEKKQAVLVVGMHRSGTSMVASTLESMGYFIGSSPLHGNEENPLGFFESGRVTRLNDEILFHLGACWDSLGFIWDVDFNAADLTLYRNKIRELVSEEFSDAPNIAIKDPRICLLLPLWREELKRLGYEVKHLVVLRNPLEAARSQMKRHDNYSDFHVIGASEGQVLLLWYTYMRRGLHALAGIYDPDIYIVSYEKFLASPKEHLVALAGFVGAELPGILLKDKTDQIIVPDLKRNSASRQELLAIEPEGRFISGMYDGLAKLAWPNGRVSTPDLKNILSETPDFSCLLELYQKQTELLHSASYHAMNGLRERLDEKNLHYEKAVADITFLAQLFDGVCTHTAAIRKSARWRMGHAAASLLNLLRLKTRRTTGFHLILARLEKYRQWRKINRPFLRAAQLDSLLPPPSSTLPNLLFGALQNPLLTLKLATPRRIRGFIRLYTHGDEGGRKRSYERYIKEYRPRASLDSLAGVTGKGSPAVIPFFSSPTVSIIIPVHNQWDYTYDCINSIGSCLAEEVTFEIILADDMSNDQTSRAAELFPNLKIVRNTENLGFLKNCNRAARYARGDYLLFLNNDTLVTNGWLSSLHRLMEQNRSVVIAGSKLLSGDGTLQEAGGILWSDGIAWNFGRGGNPDASEYNYVKEVDYVSGACMMVRKTFWEQVGGFDERYTPAYYEDGDLAMQARELGYKVMYQPASMVIHFEGGSHGTDLNSGLKAYQVNNREIFLEKWAEVLKRDHLPNAKNVLLARDRSIDKKHLVYVDHYVPHFDSDAGSRCALQYLEALRDNGFSITFIPDNFTRTEPYTHTLQQMGIEVLDGFEWSKDWKKWFVENAHHFSHVFLNRPHVSIKYIDFMKENSDAKVLYFGHDLHFLREQRRADQDPEYDGRKKVRRYKKMELDICSKADVVYYPSDAEVKILKELMPHKTIRAIPLFIYPKPEAMITDFSQNQGIIFVAGYNHPPNEDGIHYFLEKVFPSVVEKIPEIRLILVGSKMPDWLKNYKHPNVEPKGFVDDGILQSLYASCRISIAPLTYGAGVKGKVIEALYNGLPVITTPIGAEGLPDSKALLIADSAEEYADKLVNLYSDINRLSKLSHVAYKYVGDYFSMDSALRCIGQDFGIEVKQ